MKQILVVGCGPTGLVTAAVLKRHGVDVTIIDKYPGILRATKAAALHARTLEVFDALGLADQIIAEGQKVEYLNLRAHYEDRLTIQFKALKDTKFPFMIDLAQYRVEEMLHELLEGLETDMRRAVKLTELKQSDGQVKVILQPMQEDGKTPRGSPQEQVYDYVLGCDGAHSTVRDQIGKRFEGGDYAEPWALTDARLEWPIPRNEMTFASDETGICGVFPLQGEKQFRVAYTQPIDDEGNPVPPNEDNMRAALRRQGEEFEVYDTGNFWTFDLDHRQVDHYRSGNVFLVGDAGHVHTPFGGQGLNLSVCDAFNLGWKLAAVAKGGAADALLDTYTEERHSIAAEVIYLTHVGASAMLQRKGPLAAVRDLAFTLINMPDGLKLKIAYQLSQLSHSYGKHTVFGGQVGRGDRLLNVLFRDGYTDELTRLYERIKPGVLNLVCALSGLEERSVRPFVDALSMAKQNASLPLRTTLITRFHVNDPDAIANVDNIIFDRQRELDHAISFDTHCFLVRPDSHVGEHHIAPKSDEVIAAIQRLYHAGVEAA